MGDGAEPLMSFRLIAHLPYRPFTPSFLPASLLPLPARVTTCWPTILPPMNSHVDGTTLRTGFRPHGYAGFIGMLSAGAPLIQGNEFVGESELQKSKRSRTASNAG